LAKTPTNEEFLGSWVTSTKPVVQTSRETAESDSYLELCADVLTERAMRSLLSALDSPNEQVALRAACKLLDMRMTVYQERKKRQEPSLFDLEVVDDPFGI